MLKMRLKNFKIFFSMDIFRKYNTEIETFIQ